MSYSNFDKTCNVWIGGLFTPEAFITATRQSVAQSRNWSLEELVLSFTVYDDDESEEFDCSKSFGLIGTSS